MDFYSVDCWHKPLNPTWVQADFKASSIWILSYKALVILMRIITTHLLQRHSWIAIEIQAPSIRTLWGPVTICFDLNKVSDVLSVTILAVKDNLWTLDLI